MRRLLPALAATLVALSVTSCQNNTPQTHATAANDFDDGICFITSELKQEGFDENKTFPINQNFTWTNVDLNCKGKSIGLNVASNIPKNGQEKSELNKLLCARPHRPAESPYFDATNHGWNIYITLTFPDGTTEQIPLCK